MKVKELVELLQTFPQDLQVIVPQYSECVLLDKYGVYTTLKQEARQDEWVHDCRPDKPRVTYLYIGD